MEQKMICTECGLEMNHHADKLVYSDGATDAMLGGAIEEFHACPGCGKVESQISGS
jgi:hypothetical protein